MEPQPQEGAGSNPSLPEGTTRSERKLLKRYAELRREQYALITRFSDTLARVDNFPEDLLEQVRDALFHADFPFLMVLVGPFSAGKSSIINALLGESALDVGPIPTTDHIYILRHGPQLGKSRAGEITTIFHPNSLLENLSFVDTPGLESVFERHEQITRRFLHRADLVVLVMVATHVLSASNLEFLREVRDYGKRVLIMVNQVDLLEEEERQTIRDFVVEQSRLHLGFESTVWLVSAKQALEAQKETPRDEILYDSSGFAEVEEFISDTLGDVARIKQKLATPLQIVTNVREKAEERILSNQQTLDEQRKTLENIESQIEGSAHEQRKTVTTFLSEVDGHWDAATASGTAAIDELFHFSRAARQVISGLGEMVGIAAIIRRFGGQTRAQAAFEKHNVGEALKKVSESVDRIGPRLEGRDVQDLDDLTTYTRAKVEALPANLKDKIIGKIQPPMGYDRTFLRRVRPQLDDILSEGSRFETQNLDRQLRNMVIFAALWEIILALMALVFVLPTIGTYDGVTTLVIFAVTLALALCGLLLLPLRGTLLKASYRTRMNELKRRYHDKLSETTQEVVTYGIQLRRDSVAPFTRLIEAQGKVSRELKTELDDIEAAMLRIQQGLASL